MASTEITSTQGQLFCWLPAAGGVGLSVWDAAMGAADVAIVGSLVDSVVGAKPVGMEVEASVFSAWVVKAAGVAVKSD